VVAGRGAPVAWGWTVTWRPVPCCAWRRSVTRRRTVPIRSRMHLAAVTSVPRRRRRRLMPRNVRYVRQQLVSAYSEP
jgi:hypothetical protein